MTSEGEQFQNQIVMDAQELSATDFIAKHGRSNLHIFDRVRKETDKSIAAYGHLIHLLLQAKKFVEEAHETDFLDVQVDNWRKLYIDKINHVLGTPASVINAEVESLEGQCEISDD